MSTGPVLDYQTPAKSQSHFAWLGWAVYLAMSWTWCIGMFLPVLLVRDFGVWGWVVFAVPNVLGAAAMGWVLRNPQHGRAMVAAHRPVLIAFSVLTAAFQIFFVCWIYVWMYFGARAIISMILAFFCLSLIFAVLQKPWLRQLAAICVLLISLVCMVGAWSTGALMTSSEFRYQLHRVPQLNEMTITPLFCFGFLLCPYLDLTLHGALQHLGERGSRAGFAIGFGFLFFGMMVFSLAYAMPLDWDDARIAIAWWLGIYFLVQVAFTAGVHWEAAASALARKSDARVLGLILGTAAVGILSASLSHVALLPFQFRAGEVVYRAYVGFYGSVFPAYVWLCMIPGRGWVAPTKRQWITFAVAVLVAAPMYWLGFIEGKMIWLLPGLAVVLLTRVFVPSVRVT